MTTIAEKVYDATRGDQSPIQKLYGLEEGLPLGAMPEEIEDQPITIDLYAWSLYFGMAYGLARAEDPYAHEETWNERAYAAATEVNRWSNTIGGRSAELVR